MITALVSTIPALVMVGFALVGLGVSSIFPVVYILASKEKSMLPSAALAAVSSIGFIGFLVGPPVIGFIAEGVGLRTALLAVVLLGSIIVILASKQKPVND
jgi:MFS family permease